MKKLLITLFALTLSLGISAQKGMSINKLFKGGLHDNEKVSETLITGSKIEEYGLNCYHSLSTQVTAYSQKMEEAVLEDAKKSISKEVQYVDGRLYYGFFAFSSNNFIVPFRYIFYLNKTLKGGKDIILIYMDGEANIKQVKKMLKK